MSIKTQGTDLFAIDPQTNELIEVGCVTSIDGIDTAVDQIEVTCLSETARSYVAGLATPGTATFGINFDPSDESHVRLHQLKKLGLSLQWAIGWSDGTSTPSPSTSGDFDFASLPTNRSWIKLEGFMNSFPFNFAQNSVVQSTVGIQVSGDPVVIPKSA